MADSTTRPSQQPTGSENGDVETKPGQTTVTASAAPFTGQNPNQSTGTSSSEQSPITFDPTPNIVGDYYQPTYYMKLSLPNELVKPTDEDPAHVIIAETGATGLNIEDVQIEQYVGPNINTKNTFATSVTLTLIEPHGARLPDILIQAAIDMKVKNFQKAPWILELKLFGYDGNGRKQTIMDKSWRWRLLFLDIETKIDAAGSRHTLTALPLQESALENQYAILPTAYSIKTSDPTNTTGATLGFVMKKLVEAMTDTANSRYGPGFLKYEVQFVPYSSDAQAGSNIKDPGDHKLFTDNPHENDERCQDAAQFSPGTDIPSVVDSLLSTSQTACELALLSRKLNLTADGSQPDPESATEVSPVSVLHKVDTEVEITSWSSIWNDYCRTVTFVVRPYDTLRLMTGTKNAQKFLTDTSLQRKKAKYAIDKLYLTKSYEYLFTGLNTEIENFDINVNFRWAVAVPMLGGRVHYGSATIPRQVNEAVWNRQRWQLIEQSQEQLEAAKQAVADAGNHSDQVARTNQIQQRLDNIRKNLDPATIEQNKKDADEFQQSRKDLGSGNKGYAEEEVETQTGQASSTYDLPIPVTMLPDSDNPAQAVEFGTSTVWHEGRSVYGSLLNQMYGAFDGNLNSIDLTIRGDPYWLGPSQWGIEDRKVASTADSPNFANGEHMFLFRFKIPLGADASGQTRIGSNSGGTFGDSDTYSGFYATYKVTHSFSRGKFTQILNAVRIPGWQINKVLNVSGETPASGGK